LNQRSRGDQRSAAAESYREQTPEQLLRRARHFVRTRLMLRTRAMFLVPIPLMFMGLYSAITGSAIEMAGRFGGFALFMLAAWMLMQGQKAQHAYEARDVAKPPVLPRKLLASLLTGSAVAVTSLFGFLPLLNEPVTAAVYAIVATLLHSICFGLDPMRAKGLHGYSRQDANRLLQALERGEQLMEETLAAANTFPNRRLQQQVARLVEEARAVFRAIEKDPRDLQRSRKFMAVYLQGARDATVKLAHLKTHNPALQEYADYERLLTDLQQQFIRQRNSLLLNDRTELDVEVEVLRDRIKQES
jgi:5-bromo-4-chloroindolyl phosphate hydrolysis protein